jgi:hypothetical protein
MNPETDEAAKSNAIKQLIKIADLMECCERGSREYKEYAKEYRIYAKIVMPEMYKRKSKTKS